jgi:hypothetical protein
MAQEVIVALVVLSAAAFVVRRVFVSLRPPTGQAGCPSCASGSTACGDQSSPASKATTSDVKPLVLVRSKSR